LGQTLCDLPIKAGDLLIKTAQQLQLLAQYKAVMLLERSHQGLGQLR
jgi:hypothetical protein